MSTELRIRHRIATLLGHPSWAHHAMEVKMARQPGAVEQLYDSIVPALEREAAAELAALAAWTSALSLDTEVIRSRASAAASEAEIAEKEPFRFTPRMKGYAAVLGVLITVLIGMLFLRNEVEATILRLPGQLYERKDNNIIRNFYSYKLINKTSREIPDIHFKLESHQGAIYFVKGDGFEVPAQELTEGTLYIDINNAALSGDKDQLKIGVYSGDELIETATARFLAPRSYR